MKSHTQTRGNRFKIRWLGAMAGAAISLAPICAYAQSVPLLAKALPADGYASNGYASNGYASNGDPFRNGIFRSWLDMVTESQAAQPRWMTPLVTVTPRLEQEFRFDFFDQQNGKGSQGNDYHIVNWGGSKGVEFIPTYDTEIILGFPPYEQAISPKGVVTNAWGDYPMFLAKYRFISANEQSGNYIVTGFFQISEPLGNNAIGTSDKITNNVWLAQPTLAVGKGWGDFDIQMTVSQQYGFAALASPGNSARTNLVNFGDPILWNTTFQYHIFEYLWPEFEVNYETWPNGEHKGLTQVMLTPGIIFGRFQIGSDTPTRPINLIFGAGYQFAVTGNPVTANNWVATARVTF
jgi:hypothetical protein